MADNVAITAGTGTTIAADEVSDGTLGSVKVQYVKIMDGTLDGTSKATVGAAGLKVDGSGATQPVSAASLPLPTGAATAAKQPALGTAGTSSADVITVQGRASMTALLVDGTATTQPVSGTVAAAQSGTWTVQPGNTANTTAWKVDGSAVTQPVSQATASSLNAQVVGSVASGTADTGNPVKVGAVANTSSPTAAATGARADLATDVNYNLRVIIGAGQQTGADGVSNNLAFQYRNSVWGTALLPASAVHLLGASNTWDRGRAIAGSFGAAAGVMAVEEAGASYQYISTATTTQVKSGAGILHKVVINNPVALATIGLIDNTAGTTVNIGQITMPSTITSDMPVSLLYDLSFATGLRIVTSGATDLTVVYR